MIVLVALGVAITVIATWMLLRPLRARTVAASARTEEYQQRLQLRERLLTQLRELDLESADHAMDTTVVTDERRRLETELAKVLRDLEGIERSGAQVPTDPLRSNVAVIIVLAGMLPAMAFGLYWMNHRETLAHVAALDTPATAAVEVPPMVLEMVARLEQRLQSQPDDAAGWARLGRAYQVLNRGAESKRAYAHAYGLKPDDPEIISGYAGSLMEEDPSNPPPEALALFRILHARDPRHPGALWVLGLVAYNDGQFRQAAIHWEALVKTLPEGSQIEPEVRHALEQARMQAK